MDIRISTEDGAPIYQQIVSQVKRLVASGRLRPDEELPPIRALAERLSVNPNTIARAYRELENAGIVEKRKTTGTYVSPSQPYQDREERLKILSERIDSLLIEARQMDIDLDEVIHLLRRHSEDSLQLTQG